MCGIIGLISKNSNGFYLKEAELFTHMLQMDTIRGLDSTGVFGVTPQSEIDIVKGNTNGWLFTSCKQYSDFEKDIFHKYHIVIGHNRAATKGTITSDNAHPFQEENITLVHNGTIFNQEELDVSVEVDSHAIAIALSKADAVNALNKIHGPFALVWFDSKQKTLNLARNNERPLFLLEYQNYWCISSEPGLPYWLNGRDGIKPIKAPHPVPIEKIVRFDINKLHLPYSEVDFTEYEYVSTPSAYTPVWKNPQPIPKLKLVSGSTAPFKEGDYITFSIDDIKHEDGDLDWTIFGHPLGSNKDSVDINILVKTSVNTHGEMEGLRSANFGGGTITSISDAVGMPIIFVKFATPVYIDQNKNKTTDEEIKCAIANGCAKCKGTMSFVDIASSIVRKRANGTYRTLCKNCLAQSIKESETKRTEKIIAQ